ncbi:MAG: GtrA family protein [Actinomycetes bacterium]
MLKKRLLELTKFGLVGGIAYVVNFAIFNLLVHTSGAPLPTHPVTGLIIAGVVSTAVAYVGNRLLTWRDRGTNSIPREVLIFLLLNLVGIAIAAIALGVSRYILHFDSGLADNISGNIVGVGLGTIFRYWSYGKFVFTGDEKRLQR